jgi:hypothetical protein
MSYACFYYGHHYYSILAVYSRLDLRDRKQISEKIEEKKRELLVYSVSSVFSEGNNGPQGHTMVVH